MIVPVGEDLESSAHGADIGADSVELDVSECCPLDIAYPWLGDSHGLGYVVLRQATLRAQPG
ncbi:MAG TPA: hypothetical protein VFZ37_12360 [Jiangellaceae bacterium]